MRTFKLNHSSRQLWLLLLLISSVLFSCLSFARVRVSGLDDITVAAWAGISGDLVGSDTFCSISCRRGCNRPAHRRDYATVVRSYGASDSAGNFYIRSGTSRLMVYLDWTHPVAGTTRMTDFNVTGRAGPRVPGAYHCNRDANAQTAIDITLPAAQLAGARAGVYSETFMLNVCRLRRDDRFAECTARVDFTVNLPELVQVSNLSDISLGVWNGVDNLQATEDFCLFRNGYGGVAIRSNGSHDAAGRFNLQGAGSSIPYTLEYSQGGGFFAAAPGEAIVAAVSGFVGDSSRDCSNVGGTNTAVRVSVNAADIGSRDPGEYGDTVTIYVEPD